MIELHEVSRSFGDRKVLDDVSFSIAPGRMTGFVGGNGAGKTTTMRIILGVLSADSGSVTVDGEPITADYRAAIGYLPEERGLYPKMRIDEQLVYLARLHSIPAPAAKKRAAELLDLLGLGERAKDDLESLSLGNQQRVQIAAALMHNPQALILDEPFSGLDPLAVETLLGVLREVANAGAPVLFSSHQLEVVERLCDDLVIIADGRIRAAGERETLRREHSRPEWVLESTADLGWLREAGVQVIEFDGGHARFVAETQDEADRVLHAAIERGSVTRFAPHIRPLTEIFQEVVR
ncbi:ABC transporter ATP-binding protein [Blastococcus sp. Marseille-P5729]|uniref:ABC transporter ATP-binding protein n=1 Tax=Blastococcus sp. Marseille-P5729 TaxID=2086582 RepID=UPI000D0FBFF1|nr:ATP-binding cassette domain-containing protein [Blastococcus sp. Marseille-P5729]